MRWLHFASQDLKERELKKNENWHLRVCKKISMECHFPCNEITEIYMRNEGGYILLLFPCYNST